MQKKTVAFECSNPNVKNQIIELSWECLGNTTLLLSRYWVWFSLPLSIVFLKARMHWTDLVLWSSVRFRENWSDNTDSSHICPLLPGHNAPCSEHLMLMWHTCANWCASVDTSSSLWFALQSAPCVVQFLGFILFLCGSCSKMHHVMYPALWCHKSSFIGLKNPPHFPYSLLAPFPWAPSTHRSGCTF